MLYPNIEKLMILSKEKGIRNKLITNAKILAHDKNSREILEYLDSLTLSLDTVKNIINREIGRGETHFYDVKFILDYVRDNEIPINININTVVSKKNINYLYDLGAFLNDYDISKWKFFKFMPLRETAQKNRDEFEITDAEFENTKNVFKYFDNICQTDFRKENDMEEYTLITADGNIVKTEKGKDIIKGNAIYKNIVNFI